ncbi:LptF/LptG family permease [Pelagibacterales bacterium SAG-MED07]|nr:LptF/LptG family permease [Pelagibacterales bacterium SAG-MED07]
MILKVYQKYLIKEFLLISGKITFIFLILALIMGLLEELNFFSDFDVEYFYPIYLVLLNAPSLIYEIFPFIFLLSSQFLFLKLLDNGELNIFKNSGLSNIKILRLISIISMIVGTLIIIIFYNLSAIMKFEYLDIKKNFTKDNKYLATITENGLWIKDEINNQINFINAKKFSINTLNDVDIIQLNNNFEFQMNIKVEEVDIKANDWKLYDVKVIDSNNNIKSFNEMNFSSNFNYEEINNLFSNLSSLTIWNLFELKKNYLTINYSTTEIDYHLQRILAYPFLITIVTILSAILMLNLNFQKPKLFFIVFGILLSVIIYYINFFFGTMGKNEKIPLIISIWIPIIILMIISLIGMIRINEK